MLGQYVEGCGGRMVEACEAVEFAYASFDVDFRVLSSGSQMIREGLQGLDASIKWG